MNKLRLPRTSGLTLLSRPRTVSPLHRGHQPDRSLERNLVDTNCMRLLGDDSSDDDFGPALPSEVAPKKKRRKLPFEKVYINALPVSARYSKSLMHKDQLSFVTVAPYTDFVITSSVDGYVKFWKKMAEGIEFVKEFLAHPGEIRGVTVSADGRSFATAGLDKTVKIFDVITFGRLGMYNSRGLVTC